MIVSIEQKSLEESGLLSSDIEGDVRSGHGHSLRHGKRSNGARRADTLVRMASALSEHLRTVDVHLHEASRVVLKEGAV